VRALPPQPASPVSLRHVQHAFRKRVYEARNTIASAISSGLAPRLSGTDERNAAFLSGVPVRRASMSVADVKFCRRMHAGAPIELYANPGVTLLKITRMPGRAR
jgi:hypothetical protein